MQTQTEMLAVKGVQEYYIEMLRDVPFASLALTVPYSITTPALPIDTLFPQLEKVPEGSATYTVVDEDPAFHKRKRITVNVTWTDPADGRIRSSSVSTVVTDGGVTN